MRIAICDDDKNLCKQIHHFISDTYKDLDWIIDIYHSGEEFLDHAAAVKQRYDILFLDIEMNRISGLKVAAVIKQQNLHTYVIFITSHQEFAPSGYEVAAFRFIVKPLSKAKIIEAIEAVSRAGLQDKTISVQNSSGVFRIYLNEILYFEAQNQEVAVYTTDQTLKYRGNISDYASALVQDDFYRIHRSYLINLQHVRSFSNTEVVLDTGVTLPVSRLRAKAFGEVFHQYLRRSAI